MNGGKRLARALECGAIFVALVGAPRGAMAQRAPSAPAMGMIAESPFAEALGAQASGRSSAGGDGGGPASSVSGNPAAANILTGSGWVGDAIGFNRNGWRLGGLTINDANGLLTGGLGPGKWIGQNLTVADVSFNADEAGVWDGAMFGTQFLYYAGYGPGPVVNGMEQANGSPNALAGSVMGFNSLDGPPPVHRAELYQLWYRQALCDNRLIVRIGKSVPTYDFGNVSKPVQARDPDASIPSVSSAILTPLYVNPTMLGLIPGYYNSATGVVVTAVPTDDLYAQYGFFDGANANGVQTGLTGPQFDGRYFHIGEVGLHWAIDTDEKPGRFAVGYWGQTGALTGFSGQRISGGQGFYLFGSQRLYWENADENNNGLSFYYQFGTTNSAFVFTERYFGCGFTYHGPLRNRDDDSAGFALGWGKMTDDPNASAAYFKGFQPGQAPLGADETILTWYYQIKVGPNTFLQPNLTYIPNPARVAGTPAAFPFTVQAVMLF